MRITDVPLRESDLIARRHANGFAVTEAWSPPGKIPAHAHAMASFTVLLDGAFEERYAPIHRPHHCDQSTLLVRPAGEIHENHLGRDGGRTISIELDSARLRSYFLEASLLSSLRHCRHAAFLELGAAMSSELRQNDGAAPLALESLTLELLARLLRLGKAVHRDARSRWLARARARIHERYLDSTLRIPDLASEVDVHPVYFARAFRSAYRMTPGEYIRRLRVERARHLLQHTRETLSDIALECGFCDQSHLARAFRKHFGSTPIELRKLRCRPLLTRT